MVEAENAQQMWLAVGFLWIISIIVAFVISRFIKVNRFEIVHGTADTQDEKQYGKSVDPDNLMYDFPPGHMKGVTTGESPAEMKKREQREGYIKHVNKEAAESTTEAEAEKLLSGGYCENIRDDVRAQASILDEVVGNEDNEQIRERVTITIVTTKEALAKLELIKERTGKSYSRIITEKIIHR